MVYDFGSRLRQIRESKKMTQTQVAKKLNLSKTSISGYENNIKTPSVEVLMQLASLYRVSTDYILGLEQREVIFVDGLTSRQMKILNMLLTEFKAENASNT
ncbi:MAG: helix-turn-helix domain-containing protein [Clostridia bacterium]|nr:helix-turn-helix domain-containing protein [Clostridia bacterium]